MINYSKTQRRTSLHPPGMYISWPKKNTRPEKTDKNVLRTYWSKCKHMLLGYPAMGKGSAWNKNADIF